MQRNVPRWPQALIMISGATLILVGIIAVCFQSYSEIMAAAGGTVEIQQPQQLSAQPTNFSVTTRFPGMELIIIGALLEIVGYVGTRPWKDAGIAN
jgi:hypothetical protein